jgi:hypothetical protein
MFTWDIPTIVTCVAVAAAVIVIFVIMVRRELK